jgi:alcohol dehydrogenase class IV
MHHGELEEKLASLAIVAGEDTTGLSRRLASFKSIDAVMKLMKDVDLPTSLKEVGVPSKDLKPLAEYVVNERQFLYDLKTFNPTKLTLENVTELLQKMWEGRIGKN